MANYVNGYNQPQYQQSYQQNNNVIVVPVQGEQGASMYPVAAGNTVLLMDFNLKKFWLKSTDINGLYTKCDAYEFKEILNPVQANGNFVSRNEFEQWKNEIVDNIKALIGGKDNVSANPKQPATIQATV